MTDDDEFGEGGYRFRDLEAAGIVSGRTDLARKQEKHGFPLPLKLGDRQAWFPKSEVHAWLRQRAAQRDASIQNAKTPAAPPAAPIKDTAPPQRKARPKKIGRKRAV